MEQMEKTMDPAGIPSSDSGQPVILQPAIPAAGSAQPAAAEQAAADLPLEAADAQTEPGQRTNPGKWGLVLGGGGAKGCYHVGLWQAFREKGYQFDGISGTSIGALVGSFYVCSNLGPVTDFVLDMKPTDIAKDMPYIPLNIKETVRGGKSVLEFLLKYKDDRFDITPLKEHFLKLFNYEAFQASPIQFGCMTFNDTTQQGQAFVKADITADNALDILMASAACYPAFPKVEMNGELFIDGGYADNVPIDLLKQILPDADQIVVVDLHEPQSPTPPSLQPEMLYIQPLLKPGNTLDFSTTHAVSLYRQGYLETRKYLGDLPGRVYTFGKDDWQLMQVMEKYLDSQMEQMQVVLPVQSRLVEACYDAVLGYEPGALDNVWQADYSYGMLVESLALLAKVEPTALYSYRQFLKNMVDGLARLKLSHTEENDYKLVEMFSNLKREELILRLHSMLVKGQGHFPSAVEAIKEKIPAAYTLAYIWYFTEELVRNLV